LHPQDLRDPQAQRTPAPRVLQESHLAPSRRLDRLTRSNRQDQSRREDQEDQEDQALPPARSVQQVPLRLWHPPNRLDP